MYPLTLQRLDRPRRRAGYAWSEGHDRRDQRGQTAAYVFLIVMRMTVYRHQMAGHLLRALPDKIRLHAQLIWRDHIHRVRISLW